MLGCLRSNHPQICRHWFGDLEPLGVHDGSIYLRAHSEMQRDYLRSKCVDAFNDAARESTSQLLGIRFLGPREDAPRAAGRDAAQPADLNHAADGTPPGLDGPLIEIPRPDAPRQFGRNASEPLRVTPRAPSEPRRRIPGDTERLDEPEQIILNPDYGFEHFVVGPGNRLAHAASVAVANNPGRAYNPLFIHGDVGLGKTHLLQAICVQLLTERPGLILHYTSCDVFVNGFMESVRSGHMSQFRHRFRDVDVLVIDDIHFLANRDRTQEEFFHTFNSLYQANKQIVLSSDAAPDEIPNLENRLVSRFNWGLVTKVDPPGYETRVAILQTKASLRGIELTDEVASFVAARVTTNIRELEGAITKLQIHARVSGREIDVGLAREALGVTDEDRVGRAP
ncbi:MAG: chromosomal replication initiator protein DnaA [Planctomycetota bacterium]